MRTGLPMALATLAVLVLGYLGWIYFFGEGGRSSLRLVDVQGAVVLTRGGQRMSPVEVGAELQREDGLRVGEGGRAVVGVGEGTRLTLEEQSSIRVLDVSEDRVRVELEEGRVSAVVRPGSPSLGVSSGGRTFSSSDGAFTVRAGADGALAAQVEQGALGVEGVAGVSALQPGQRVSEVPGAAPVLGEIPAELLLSVDWPAQGPVRAGTVALQGKTEPNARVRASGAAGAADARAGPDGSFVVTVPLAEGENALKVEAESVMGGARQAEGAVSRDSEAPRATKAQVLWDR